MVSKREIKKEAERARMLEVLKLLKAAYPDAKCSLDYTNPFELLCATILSAQCTDERVNKVVPDLFKKFPTAAKMAKAKLPDVERLIMSTGFYRNKAKSLVAMSQALMEEHGGKVPADLDSLTKLRGVGRKTANVILGNAYGIPGLVVDTHVGRLSRRLGFTKQDDPVKVELEMMDLVPKEDWTIYSHLLIYHGRAICDSRRPKCEVCRLSSKCPKFGINLTD